MTTMTFRRSEDRGGADHGWLNTRHTFSFADYRDPDHMGFRSLRVMNEDRVSPGRGFGKHPHQNMEILSYVLSGTLRHEDSMGHRGDIVAGDFQLMSAGRGVVHSESNPSRIDPVHFYQIWLYPDVQDAPPTYQQKRFDDVTDRWQPVASPDGHDGSMRLRQNATVSVGRFSRGTSASLDVPRGRSAWLQLIRGEATVDASPMRSGDGVAITEIDRPVTLGMLTDTEWLAFDMV